MTEQQPEPEVADEPSYGIETFKGPHGIVFRVSPEIGVDLPTNVWLEVHIHPDDAVPEDLAMARYAALTAVLSPGLSQRLAEIVTEVPERPGLILPDGM